MKIKVTFGTNERVSARDRRRTDHGNDFDVNQTAIDKSVASVDQSCAHYKSKNDNNINKNNNNSCNQTCNSMSYNVTCDGSRFAHKNNNRNDNNSKNLTSEDNKSVEVDSLYSGFVDSGDSFSE